MERATNNEKDASRLFRKHKFSNLCKIMVSVGWEMDW